MKTNEYRMTGIKYRYSYIIKGFSATSIIGQQIELNDDKINKFKMFNKVLILTVVGSILVTWFL